MATASKVGAATEIQPASAATALAVAFKVEATWRPIEQMTEAEIADELGMCKAKCAQVDKYEKRAKELTTVVLGGCSDLRPEQAGELRGARWTICIAAQTMVSRILDIRKVYRAMGAEAFWTACSITLEAIDSAVSPEKYASLVAQEQVGYRRVTAISNQVQVIEPSRNQAA